MGIEHVFIEYDPAKPINRFELGTRKLVRTIELEHFKVEASAPDPDPPDPDPPDPDPPASVPDPRISPHIVSFVASSTSVLPNTSFTLTAVFTDGIGTINGTNVTSGQAFTHPGITQSSLFSLTVTSSDGFNAAQDSIYVQLASADVAGWSLTCDKTTVDRRGGDTESFRLTATSPGGTTGAYVNGMIASSNLTLLQQMIPAGLTYPKVMNITGGTQTQTIQFAGMTNRLFGQRYNDDVTITFSLFDSAGVYKDSVTITVGNYE